MSRVTLAERSRGNFAGQRDFESVAQKQAAGNVKSTLLRPLCRIARALKFACPQPSERLLCAPRRQCTPWSSHQVPLSSGDTRTLSAALSRSWTVGGSSRPGGTRPYASFLTPRASACERSPATRTSWLACLRRVAMWRRRGRYTGSLTSVGRVHRRVSAFCSGGWLRFGFGTTWCLSVCCQRRDTASRLVPLRRPRCDAATRAVELARRLDSGHCGVWQSPLLPRLETRTLRRDAQTHTTGWRCWKDMHVLWNTS
jgi:hypothetical protein